MVNDEEKIKRLKKELKELSGQDEIKKLKAQIKEKKKVATKKLKKKIKKAQAPPQSIDSYIASLPQ